MHKIFAMNWLGPVRRRLRQHRSYRELSQLDDRTLQDIGISRGELMGISRDQHRS